MHVFRWWEEAIVPGGYPWNLRGGEWITTVPPCHETNTHIDIFTTNKLWRCLFFLQYNWTQWHLRWLKWRAKKVLRLKNLTSLSGNHDYAASDNPQTLSWGFFSWNVFLLLFNQSLMSVIVWDVNINDTLLGWAVRIIPTVPSCLLLHGVTERT